MEEFIKFKQANIFQIKNNKDNLTINRKIQIPFILKIFNHLLLILFFIKFAKY